MTAQIHEVLLLDGKWTSLAASPPLPPGHARVRAATPEELSKSPGIIQSTACWRGYVGSWEIRGDKLYLIAIDGAFRLVGEEPLFADWVTETVRVPNGETVDYVHMGFAPLFAEETLITIERGVVTGRRTIDNRGKPAEEQRKLIRGLLGEGATGYP